MNAERDAALAALIAEVQPGWTMDVTNHDYPADGGRHVVTEVSTNVHGSGPGLHSRRKRTGRPATASYLIWPTPERDFEVEGRTLRIYNPDHAYVHGNRALILEMRFLPPEGNTHLD